MKRRVIKQGNNTLTITLPRKWAERFNVKAGDELEVEEKTNKLIINTNGEHSLGKISLHIPKTTAFARRLIFAPYFKGYNEIEVSFEGEDTLENIHDCARTMLGFEVVQQGRNYCVLKNVAREIESEFKTIFNRLALISISMGKELYESLKEDKPEKLPNISKMEELSNKFCLFCRRILNSQKYDSGEKNNSLYRLSCLFEEIADDYRDACNLISSSKIKVSRETLDLLKKINDFQEEHYKLLHKPEVKKILELKKAELDLLKSAENLTKKRSGEELLVIYYLLHILKTNHNISEEIDLTQ